MQKNTTEPTRTETLEYEIIQLKATMQEVKDNQKKFEHLIKLEENDEWKELKKMYFDDERERVSRALTGTDNLTPEIISELHGVLSGIRRLKQFLTNIELVATSSGIDMKQYEDAIHKREVELKTISDAEAKREKRAISKKTSK